MDTKEKYIKIHSEKGGFRGRINAKCIECVFDPMEPGTWRAQVEACTVKTCPLYDVRPKIIKKDVDSSED